MRKEDNSSLKRDLKRICIDIVVHLVAMYLYYHLFLFPSSYLGSGLPQKRDDVLGLITASY